MVIILIDAWVSHLLGELGAPHLLNGQLDIRTTQPIMEGIIILIEV
jgi:hypothetical protein